MKYYLVCSECDAAFDTIEAAHTHQEFDGLTTLGDEPLEDHGGFDVFTEAELASKNYWVQNDFKVGQEG